LHRVQFLNAKTGWAWGETSEFYSSGVFSSDNAGRLWHPANGSMSAAWWAGSFATPESGILAGTGGTTALVQDRGVRPVSVGTLGGRTIRCMRISNDGTAWAVADGGVILRSTSRGASWSVVSAGMPDQYQSIFDWRGMHTIASSVWVVGRPGSVLLSTSDSGQTWNSSPTGVSVPLEAVWFHDRQRGWAVGALGTILATQDGGRSWHVQRRGGERAAILAVHGSAASAPLLAHVQLGAEQGYLSADLAMVASRQEWDDSARSNLESRLADAVCIAGGTRAEVEWRFPHNPLAQSLGQVLDDWNRRGEGKALEDLERRLVVAIRSWRPEVVVAESADPAETPDAASALVSQALGRAYQSAADATAFPELIDSARLGPWSVKKLYAATRSGTEAEVRIDAGQLSRSPSLAGRPLDDRACLAMSLVAESYRASPTELGFRRVASRLPGGKSDDSLISGIVLEPGGPARRKLLPPAEITDAHRQAVQAHRNLLAIVNRADGQPILARQLNAQLDDSLRNLGPAQAGNILYGLARTHFSQGRWTDCRELLEKLLSDYPDHLSAFEAQRWLVQFYASSEARHRERLGSIVGQATVSGALPRLPAAAAADPSQSDSRPPVDRNSTTARLNSSRQVGAVGGMGSDIAWAKGSVEAAKRLMHASPLSWSDPTVQFPLAAAQRMLGYTKDADKFYTTFSLGRDFGPWSDAARSERWIRDRKGMPTKPVVMSIRTSAPPHLDGKFDDPVWKASPATTLQDLQRSEGQPWDTQLRVAHDGNFLYFAISCYSNFGDASSPLRPRTRDMDLSAHDRIDLYLDVDRDYTTYYHLAADQRGCVFDDCWGDRTWDPTWYVASAGDEHGYRIEAAVPLTELTDTPPADGTIWAFGAVRIVPGQRVMSWSRPAGTAPRPEGLGYLLFSDGPIPPPPRPAVAN
jgi:photosystem II stability/assembly factor-like uncharacterized protein